MSYTLDNADRITALAQTGTGFTNNAYGYDSRDHLTSYFDGTTTTGYGYDGDGNRYTSTALSVTTTYNYPGTSNRLTSLFNGTATTSYSYDADGHLLSDGTSTWTYDDRGRMATAFSATVTTSYGINALGERITKSSSAISGGENEYVYDEADHLLGEYDYLGNIIQETVYLGDLPIAELRGTGMSAATYYITPDHLGAPHIITNGSGTVVWYWNPSAFGDVGPNQNPSGLGAHVYNVRYPGQYADAETGLDYNLNRDYISSIDRYAQSDLIGLLGGINTYLYANGNPISNFDSDGKLSAVGPIYVIGTAIIVGGYILSPAGQQAIHNTCDAIRQWWNSPNQSIPPDASISVPDAPPSSGDHCEELLRIDTDTCNAITKRRGKRSGAICHASASERYAACLSGKPLPPLNTWNN